MLVVDWRHFQPTNSDLENSIRNLSGTVHMRVLLKKLVRAVLDTYPWENRADLIRVFDPEQAYEKGDWVAFSLVDEQHLRPDSWRVGEVRRTESVENHKQGRFQVVWVNLDGKTQIYAGKIKGAQPLPLAFPSTDQEDIDWLVSDIERTYRPSLSSAITTAIEDGYLLGQVLKDEVFLGNVTSLLGEEDSYYLEEIFAYLPEDDPWLTTGQILERLCELGMLVDVPDDVALIALKTSLRNYGFHNLGGERWIAPDCLAAINRLVERRMAVPHVRSKVAQELGEDDTPDFDEYAEVDLNLDGQQALEELGEDTSHREKAILGEWIAPSIPILLPTLTYLHIMEGFFPMGKRLGKAFKTGEDPSLVHIQVVDGDPVPFLVSQEEGVVKALDPEVIRHRFLEIGIPAGTRLWLEYRNEYEYRLFPRPLPAPKPVRCKLVFLDEGHLVIQESEIQVAFEHNANIFKAELRFEDLGALFAEADQKGLSIFDTLYYTFEELTAKNPNTRLHYTEAFNAVFFQQRMCSPRSVESELYTRPCFVPVGDGYFKFEAQRGVKRYGTRKTGVAPTKPGVTPPVPAPTHTIPVSTPGTLATSPGYFILQQRADASYANRPHIAYPWRSGIPGSKQLGAGARFIHYRPGERVFFGTGKIAYVESQPGDDGHTHFMGHIEDYQPWTLTLPFTRELEKRMSFFQPGRPLSVGQPGIRKVNQQDFETILSAYESYLQSESGVWARAGDRGGDTVAPTKPGVTPPVPAPTHTIPVSTPGTLATSPGYFILQQRADASYANRPHIAYPWRSGIPGSKQLGAGARFIHYRPGERVFFGTGKIAYVESQPGDDGHTHFMGHIEDYQPWTLTLPFTRELEKRMSFFQPGRPLSVGQPGIRKVNQQDFETILSAYESYLQSESGVWARAEDRGGDTVAPTKPGVTPPVPAPTHTIPVSTPGTLATSPGYFILQQRADASYANRPHIAYPWRSGIPGSKQLGAGARFIHYRPGERVFFGTGKIAYVESQPGDDGHTHFMGHIEDYQPWTLTLPFTRELEKRMSFFQPGRPLSVGQPGIRKVNQQDFETILSAYESYLQSESGVWARAGDRGGDTPPDPFPRGGRRGIG